MFKRGQISLFMILCIVILIVILASMGVDSDIMEEKAEAGAIEFQE